MMEPIKISATQVRSINVSTERLKWPPMLRHMRESTLSKKNVRVANGTKKIQSSD